MPADAGGHSKALLLSSVKHSGLHHSGPQQQRVSSGLRAPSGRPAGRYCRPSQFVACKRAKSALRKLCASPETGISRVDFPKTGGLALWRNLKALHTAEDCFPIRLLAKAAFAGPCTDLGLDLYLVASSNQPRIFMQVKEQDPLSESVEVDIQRSRHGSV